MRPQDNQSDLNASESNDFEQQVVCKILRAGGVIGNLKRYVAARQRVVMISTLDLGWFHTRFPRFPLKLIAVLFAQRPPDWTEMFKNFTTTTLFRAFQQASETVALNSQGKALGVVFNINGITFVLHNYEPATQLPGRRIVRLLGTPPVAYAFEEFETLLKCIGDDWAVEAAETEAAAWTN